MVAVLWILGALAGTGDVQDGIYTVTTDGPGPRIARNDGGGEVILGPRVGAGFGKASLRAQRNDNSLYVLQLDNAGPVAKDADRSRFAVVIDGACLMVHSHSDPHADGTINLGAQVYGAGPSQKVAERLKLELPRRRHPGHRFEVRFTPDKASYVAGETITLKMELLNTGDVPFTFMNGGRQRGPRDNQFRFLAYRSGGHGKAVPDSGDPTNHGGIGGFVTLQPGESFTKTASLDKWFNLTDPDTYRITGIFEMQLQTAAPNQPRRDAVWDELAVGDCLVRVTAKGK